MKRGAKTGRTFVANANRILSGNRITMRITPWLAMAGLTGCEGEGDVTGSADQGAGSDTGAAAVKDASVDREKAAMFALRAALLLFGVSSN